MSLLSVSGICRQSGADFSLRDVSFTQEAGQQIAIAGETGSGKSTLLRIIAGLTQPDAGAVLLDGVRVKGPDEQLLPGHPRIGYLSQHYELRNHYRVEEVLDMAAKITAVSAARIYEICRIGHLLKRRTSRLSGGERQRIALAQLLSAAPALLLLDEPFSNLDLIHKGILKAALQDAGAEMGITFILASHDPQDVLPWADELLVLKAGAVVQQGNPESVYRRPVNEYAAGILGPYCIVPQALFRPGAAHSAILRPEAFIVSSRPVTGSLVATVTGSRFMGSHYELSVLVNGHRIIAPAEKAFTAGESVFVSLWDSV